AGSLEVFHQRLQQLLSLNEDWGNIILLDDKRQLLNAAVPFGTPLPEVRPVTFEPGWIADGRPRTSDLFNARIRGQSTVAIGLPVAREDGQPVQALVVGLRLAHLGQRLASILPPDGVAGVFDRQLRFITRTRDAATYIGRPPGDLLLDAMRGGAEGVIRSVTREGAPTFTAYRRLDNGWCIGVATPSAPAVRALARYRLVFCGAWLAILLARAPSTRFCSAVLQR